MKRLPIAIPAEIAALHPDVPSHLFDETFRHACERLDRYVGALAVELASNLELPAAQSLNLDTLFTARRWSESGKLAMQWLLETLELYGHATRGADVWRLLQDPPTVTSTALREEAERIMPAAKPAYEVLALCAGALPAVLRGELRGEDALFSPATFNLWFQYFSNDNPHYGPSNAITAVAAARATGAGASVLEFGGGGGSAGLAVLRSLGEAGNPPAGYRFTELQSAFLRRGARIVQQAKPGGCELSSSRFDINADPADQGLARATFDLIFGVNTLHLAHDLQFTLHNLRGLLRPGGALVVGELLRPAFDAPVHLELPFTLLEEYRHAPLVPGIRTRPGFLSARGWVNALSAAGFSQITLLPAQIERCAELYPGFYSGALTARL
jgi:SAM-dependent methyltransferase